MAYDIFSQLQGPQIDTDLFGRNTSRGIDAGNASPTKLTAGINGLVKGVQTGQEIYANYQQSEIRQNQIDQQPVTNAQQQATLEQTQIANDHNILLNDQLKKEVESGNAALKIENENATLKAQAVAIKQQQADIETQKQINADAASNDPATQAAIMNNAAYTDFMLRHPNDASHILGKISGSLSPEQLDAATRQVDFIKAQEIDGRLEAARTKLLHDQAKTVDDAYKNVSGDAQISTTIGSAASDPKALATAYTLEQAPGNTKMFQIKDKATGFFLTDSAGAPTTIDEASASKFQAYQNAYNANQSLLKKAYGIDDNKIAAKKVEEAAAPVPTLQNQATPGPTPTPAPTNAAANARLNSTFEKNRAQAKQTNQVEGYAASVVKGQKFIPTPTPVTIATTNQNKPVPPTQASITQTVAPEKQDVSIAATDAVLPKPQFNHVAYLENKTSALLGTPTKVNFIADAPHPSIIAKVNSLPELEGYSPLIKGMVAVESAGNRFAVSPTGAGGLMQLMPGTAAELGLQGNQVFDGDLNVAAGAKYIQDRFTRINKKLQIASGQTGTPVILDPRIGLAAYNGGDRDVLRAISKGYTSWSDIKPYLISVKNSKAAKENVEYPEKVMAATIAFMQGGNQADDSMMKSLLSHGMVDIDV